MDIGASSGATSDVIAALQDRIDRASSGATLDVPAGRYAGRLRIHKDLILVGAGAASSVFEASAPSVELAPGLDVTLVGLGFIGPRVPAVIRGRGGALRLSSGRLRLIRCAVSGHRAVFGGAVYAGGTAVFRAEDSRFADGWADKGGGGLAIMQGARAELVEVVFEGNRAGDAGHHLYVMGRPRRHPAGAGRAEVRLERVTFSPCEGRGSSIANVRGFEGRITRVSTPWPADSVKVPQTGSFERGSERPSPPTGSLAPSSA